MGLLDLFLSPQKQIEKENRLLAKPGYTVAEVVSQSYYDREEHNETEDGGREWRTIREAIVTFRFKDGDVWQEVTYGPSEGYTGFYLGQQLIIKQSQGHISRYCRTLHRDSPNHIHT